MTASTGGRARVRLTGYLLRRLPARTLGTALLLLAAALAPAAMMAGAAGLINEVGLLVTGGPANPYPVFGLLVAAIGLGELAVFAFQAAATGLACRAENLIRSRGLAASAVPGAPPAAEPANALAALIDGPYSPQFVIQSWLVVGTRLLTAGLAVLVLARYSIWFAAVVCAVYLLARRWLRDHFLESAQQVVDDRGRLARATYFADLPLIPAFAKEIRLFGLQSFLRERTVFGWAQAAASHRRSSSRLARRAGLATALVGLCTVVALVVLTKSGIDGEIGVGELVLYLQALLLAQGLTRFASPDVAVVKGMPGVVRALDVAGPTTAEPATGPASVATGPPGIRLERVRFGYPGSARPVLRDLDLELPAGHCTALVGENGAGKTSVLRLLQRAYPPDAGRVLADGHDLSTVDLSAWYQRLAVAGQDFVRYPLSLAENIGTGATSDRAAIERAAAAAGLAEVWPGLPSGLDTVLDPGYEGGADLSGGQWQRVALARALATVETGADLVLLDEPTSHLDIRAEAEMFRKLLDHLRGRTVLLVSHRFASVRVADHIVVLDAGTVLEQGTHTELMRREGRYAELYRLQAARFLSENGANA